MDPLTPLTHSIRLSGLPRRTYQTALRRSYDRQWLCDRFVPGPALTGLPFIAFQLVRVGGGNRDEILRRARRSPGITLCWSLTRWILCVSFVRDAAAAEEFGRRIKDTGVDTEVRSLVVDALTEGVSSYFDFEGEWNRYGGLTGLRGYPHDLRDRLAESSEDPPAPSPRLRRTVEEMVGRPLPVAGRPTSVSRRPRWSLRFAERTALRGGWLEARSFLNPMAAARTLADFAGGVTFVHGSLRDGKRSSGLIAELSQRAGVHPFLLASDGRSALLGFLAARPRTRLAPAPTPAESVRAVVERYFANFEVIREGLDSAESVVAHRYERTLAPALLKAS